MPAVRTRDSLLIHDPATRSPHWRPAVPTTACTGTGTAGCTPERYGEGVRTVGSTTGGALADALTPGPLKMGAEMSIMRIDRTTGAPVDVQYVSVGMDASVEFSDWVPFPGPAPAIVVDPTDEDADDAPVDEGDAA